MTLAKPKWQKIMPRLTRKEWLLLEKHIYADIAYGEQGTFHKFSGNNYKFDHKEAEKAKAIIAKLAALISK